MAFQVSPGVQVKEIDLTNVIPAVSTSIGGFAGAFNWGPVEEIRTVGSEKELAAIFGTPDNNTAVYFLTAASFLTYGNALKVVRALTAGMLNATTGATGLLVKNRDHLEDVTTTSFEFIAKYPGVLGNSLKVEVCPADAATFTGWAYADQFDAAPSTSEWASDRSCSNDELHIAVIDEDGAWTGTPGTVLETFPFVSQASDAKTAQGMTSYWIDVINKNSAYVWAGAAPALLTFSGFDTTSVSGNYLDSVDPDIISEPLSGGVDNNTPTVGEIQVGFDMFEDAETLDVDLLFAVPGANEVDAVTLANDILSIATTRKDLVAFVSPPISTTVGTTTAALDLVIFAGQLSSTSYGVIDSTALKVYDKYNDVYRWIPAAGHMAGLCANTDSVADAWFSPAGFNRGQLLGITKIAFNPKQADRDTLYKARINPIVSFPGQGTVLYGDKTAQTKPSAFDRINVRRLFITLEKAISTAAKFQLFEFNDEFTRAMFRNMVEPFLRDVKGRRGITDFAVVCDATNNTGEVVDTNRFVADIYIKPARSINFITLNFIATRTGVEFSEIIGQ